MTAKTETMRRLRLGDVKRYLRYRYGPTLPDDDAGRVDLYELLLAVSLAPKSASRIMANIVEIWAPWMDAAEASGLIQQVEQTPPELRRRTAGDIGQRFNVTNAEREHLRLWTIRPVDMTDAEIERWRKDKRNQRDKARRRKAGKQSRITRLATALTKLQPWKAEGICRRTWERRRQRLSQPCRSHTYKQTLSNAERILATPVPVESQQGASHRCTGSKGARLKQDNSAVLRRGRRHAH
jgi:hypothetical protein